MSKRKANGTAGLSRAVTPEEVAAIEAAATDERDALFVRLLYETGARLGELIELRVDDLKPRDQRIRLRNEKNGDGAEKLVTLQEDTFARAEAYCRDRRLARDEYVFPGRAPGSHISIRMASYRFEKLAIAANVSTTRPRDGLYQRVWPHTLRHGCATQLIRDGVNLRVIQEHLGHASLASTEVYLHVVGEDARREIGKVHFR